MLQVEELYEELKRIAPPELAEEWDNVGLLVDCRRAVSAVLCALDITAEVVREAGERGCELIVAHHPVIFRPLAAIGPESPVFSLVQGNISAICMHTNLDSAKGGVNDVLASLLDLREVQPFVPFGRVGGLARPLAVPELAAQCAGLFGPGVKYVDCGKTVKRLAVVSGKGGDYFREARQAGADCLLTGEALHHEGLDARQEGISLVVAGHYATERPVVPVLAQALAGRFPDVAFHVSERDVDPFSYVGC